MLLARMPDAPRTLYYLLDISLQMKEGVFRFAALS